MEAKAVMRKVVLGACLVAASSGAHAQVGQAAHDAGVAFGKAQRQQEGTSAISEETASQLPFTKKDVKQQSDYQGGYGDMMNIGVGRITQSKTYSGGTCDREGFDPVESAKAYLAPGQWDRMSAEQRQKAVSDQVKVFDQECEGINFLAGEYRGRVTVEPCNDPLDPVCNFGPPPISDDSTGKGCETRVVTEPDEYATENCTEANVIAEKSCTEEPTVQIYYDQVLPDAEYVRVVANSKAPDWTITVNPKQGWADVTGYHVPIGTHWETCNSGGDAGMDYPCEVTDFGTKTERISIYGAQTAMTQGYRCGANGNCGEWFVVYSQVIDQCTFRFNNYHIRGGAGYPDIHDYSQYNFCVPERRVSVQWNNNCSALAAAVK